MTMTAAAILGIALWATPAHGQSAAGNRRDSASHPATAATAANGDSVRPFRIKVTDKALVDLRRRIAATRWPERRP